MKLQPTLNPKPMTTGHEPQRGGGKGGKGGGKGGERGRWVKGGGRGGNGQTTPAAGLGFRV